jgi:hypothetical protein
MLVARTPHITSRPRVFLSSEDSCPLFSVFEFVNSVHNLKAGALAHALPRRCILESIDRNNFSGTAASAIWKTVILEWETILAPIFMSFSWMLDSDQ